jgi:hypothetical protein
MKKYLYLATLATSLFLSSSMLVAADQLKYIPLEPIQGLSLDTRSPDSLPLLLNQIFMILFSLGGLLAVVMLTVGGIQYMISSAVPTKKEGLERARAAIYGILILASSYLILYTINPNLTQMQFLLPTIAQNTNQNIDPNNTGATDPRISSSACFATQGTGSTQVGYRDYSAGGTSPCLAAVKGKLSAGQQVLSTGPGVIVFKSTDTITQWQAALNQFVGECSRTGGNTSTIGNTTENSIVYACLVKR